MGNISEIIPGLIAVAVLFVFWLIIRNVFKALSNKINNGELYKEDTLKVLEEIRDELKELNRHNSPK